MSKISSLKKFWEGVTTNNVNTSYRSCLPELSILLLAFAVPLLPYSWNLWKVGDSCIHWIQNLPPAPVFLFILGNHIVVMLIGKTTKSEHTYFDLAFYTYLYWPTLALLTFVAHHRYSIWNSFSLTQLCWPQIYGMMMT